MKAHPHQDTIFRYFRKVETSGRFYKRPVKMGNGPPKKDQCYSATRKKEILPLVMTWITCGSWRHYAAAAAAKSLQSCPTLCDPRDGSPPGTPIPGIHQGRTLEWVATAFSNAWNWKVQVKSLSRVQLIATPWTAAYHAPPPMGFARQEYWSGLPLPSPDTMLGEINQTENIIYMCSLL